MSGQEAHIDPFKLNEILQKIADGIGFLQERQAAASPEFQILMNNYLVKANEAERNQARFEEALERLELVQQENRKLKDNNSEMSQRLGSMEKDIDGLRAEHDKDNGLLREEMLKLNREKADLESTLSQKYSRELREYRADSEKQISQMQSEISELLQIRNKLDEKHQLKSRECDALERELTDLKVRLADEQTTIRGEIIEATKRSQQIEQRFHGEKEQMLVHIRDLEGSMEELTNNLNLRQRELEYKDALLAQTFTNKPQAAAPQFIQNRPVAAQPAPDLLSHTSAQTAQMHMHLAREAAAADYAPNVAERNPVKPALRQAPFDFETVDNAESPSNAQIGGIWSKLNPSG